MPTPALAAPPIVICPQCGRPAGHAQCSSERRKCRKCGQSYRWERKADGGVKSETEGKGE